MLFLYWRKEQLEEARGVARMRPITDMSPTGSPVPDWLARQSPRHSSFASGYDWLKPSSIYAGVPRTCGAQPLVNVIQSAPDR